MIYLNELTELKWKAFNEVALNLSQIDDDEYIVIGLTTNHLNISYNIQ